jgi:predicted ATP-binding protein involved in virulence
MQSLNIQRLKLRDYRCFDALDIDFHPRLTVLVASNGAGKTSILDSIAVAFGPYIGAFDEAVGKHFEASDIRMSRIRESHTNEMEYAARGVRLEATGYVPGSLIDQISDDYPPISWRRALAGPTKAKTTIKDAKELIEYGKRMQESIRTPGKDDVLPLLAYYGTGRLWQQKKLTLGKKLGRTSRTIGYSDCLDPASSYKAFVEWFRYWSLNAKDLLLKDQADSPAYKEFESYIASVQGAVDACLSPAGWNRLEYSFALDTLVAHHAERGVLPVELMSDGIRNMVGMVADIAFRATKLNPQLGAQAAKMTAGVVLIDEVDMHLHPAWQQTVLQSLQTSFPAVQFIVTTHSPQVLTSVDAACIRSLIYETNSETGAPRTVARPATRQTLGVASADLLAEIMGVDPIPDVLQAHWVSDYHALIQQNLYAEPEGLELRQKLEEHFGSTHPVLRECDRLIRLQTYKARMPRAGERS